MIDTLTIDQLIQQLIDLKEDVKGDTPIFVEYGLPGDNLCRILGALLSIYKPTNYKVIVLAISKA